MRRGEGGRVRVEGRKHSITGEKRGGLISHTIGIRNRTSSTISRKPTRKERARSYCYPDEVTCALLAHRRKKVALDEKL